MKTRLLICTATFIIIASAPLFAQESVTLKEKYEKETILLDGNRNQYFKNKERKRMGVFGKRLKQEFSETSAESKEELAVFQRRRKRGSVLLIAGGAVFVSAAIAAPFIALPVAIGAFGSGLTGYNIGAFNLYKSRNNLQKAVWLRNRDLLVKQ